MNHFTFFLSALPSFSEGMSRVLDMGATMETYNDSPNPSVADYLALRSDWLAIGSDFRAAIEHYEHPSPRQFANSK